MKTKKMKEIIERAVIDAFGTLDDGKSMLEKSIDKLNKEKEKKEKENARSNR